MKSGPHCSDTVVVMVIDKLAVIHYTFLILIVIQIGIENFWIKQFIDMYILIQITATLLCLVTKMFSIQLIV